MKNKLFRAAASALLTLLLVVALLPVQAHAAGATLTGTAAPQAGDTVTLTLSVPNKVYGLTADLSYSGNLSFTNYNCSVSGWSIVVNNNKFSVYGTSSSSGGLVTIKMKVSGSAKEGDALTATFSNIVVSDGNSDTSLDSASWSGKVGAAPQRQLQPQFAELLQCHAEPVLLQQHHVLHLHGAFRGGKTGPELQKGRQQRYGVCQRQ